MHKKISARFQLENWSASARNLHSSGSLELENSSSNSSLLGTYINRIHHNGVRYAQPSSMEVWELFCDKTLGRTFTPLPEPGRFGFCLHIMNTKVWFIYLPFGYLSATSSWWVQVQFPTSPLPSMKPQTFSIASSFFFSNLFLVKILIAWHNGMLKSQVFDSHQLEVFQ